MDVSVEIPASKLVPAPGTRERILDLAVAALDAGGEASIRVNDIARDASVAITSLYHYFGNREGLVAAAQIARYRRITVQEFAAVQDQVDKCTSRGEFRTLMEGWIRRFLASDLNAQSRAIRVQTYGAAVNRVDIAAMLAEDQEQQGQRMFEFLEPLKLRGWIKPDVDTRTFGPFYLGVMMGHTLYEIGHPNVDHEAWIQFSLNSIMQIIPEGD